MSSCILNFDNYQSNYYPGNIITGRVICSFTESKNVRGIKLYLKGTEHNAWTESESYYDSEEKTTKTRTVNYSGDNDFLRVEHTLSGAGEMGPGRFEYQFNFELPKNIPGTYNGKYGFVKYTVKAKVDRPFKFDYEDVKELNVVSPIDFNEIKDKLRLDPVCYSDDKTLCCWCCASGPITMNVNLEKEAFVQGEVAKVRVDITNMSNENVERVEVKLGLTVKSEVKHPKHDSKSDYELLAADNDSGVGAHGDRTYEFALEIPNSSVVPNFSLCTLFSQYTMLKVKAVLGSCHNDMEIVTNIDMGHIPIGGQEEYRRRILQQGGFPVTTPYPPTQNNHFQTGSPYPHNNPPYPSGGTPTSYPSSNNVPYPSGGLPPPYPAGSNPTPYPPTPQPPYPNTIPQPSNQIGFSKSPEFPSLPTTAVPYSAPYPPAVGPSAPPPENSSAPTKEALADGDFIVLGATSTSTAPPSYNDAVPYPH